MVLIVFLITSNLVDAADFCAHLQVFTDDGSLQAPMVLVRDAELAASLAFFARLGHFNLAQHLRLCSLLRTLASDVLLLTLLVLHLRHSITLPTL